MGPFTGAVRLLGNYCLQLVLSRNGSKSFKANKIVRSHFSRRAAICLDSGSNKRSIDDEDATKICLSYELHRIPEIGVHAQTRGLFTRVRDRIKMVQVIQSLISVAITYGLLRSGGTTNKKRVNHI